LENKNQKKKKKGEEERRENTEKNSCEGSRA